MNILDIIKESFHSLRVNIKRTMLTVLGIVIGIFAVTIMLSLGEGIKESISADMSSARQGDVSLAIASEKRLFDNADLDWLQKQLYVKHVLAMNKIYNQKVRFSDHLFKETEIETLLGPFSELERVHMVSGKQFDWADANFDEPVLLASSSFAENFKKKTHSDVLHKELFIKGKKYQVIGVFKDKTNFYSWNDGTLYAPYAVFSKEISGERGYRNIALHLKNPDYYKITAEHITKSLNLAHGLPEKSFDFAHVNTPRASFEETKKFTSKFNLFLGIIGGISLLVGGIGTMNMMLTTISERTKEIGLRKAIGARNRDITVQVLFESIYVTLLGGIIGVLITVGLVAIANPFIPEDLGFKLAISMKVILLAVSVSVFVGIIFGISPAKKAARLQPVEALRSE